MNNESNNTTTLVPFGKYKGKPAEVLRNDPDYCDWLMSQDWFRSRYQGVYNIIINNFTEPADTPEHNALQAKFLSDDFVAGFIRHALKYDIFSAVSMAFKENSKACQNAKELLEKIQKEAEAYRAEKEAAEDRQIRIRCEILLRDLEEKEIQAVQMLDEFDSKRERTFAALYEEYYQPTAEDLEYRIDFEVRGWDVVIDKITLNSSNVSYCTLWNEFNTFIVNRSDSAALPGIHIEIKPAVGDDYPTILRQMKSNGARITPDERFVLIYDAFTARGVTEAQMKQTFEKSGIITAQFSEIED